MRKHFSAYYSPSDQQLSEMWKAALFTFDANVLLNIYRYSQSTRDVLFQILDQLGERIWVPHQAALEFHRGRRAVISTQARAYDEVRNMLNGALLQFKGKYPRHSSLDIEQLTSKIKHEIEGMESTLEREKSRYQQLEDKDALLERITNLFDGKVGEPYASEALDKFYKEADRRYQNKIPPGYGDAKKPVPDKYGDFIVWSQLKDVAALQQKPIIFITDDAKEDWWLKHEGKTIGPKPELIHEMQADAQVDFHMYSSDRFIDRAQAELGIEGRQAVKEVKWIVADRSREWHSHPEYDLLTGLMDRRILSSALQQAIEQWNFSGEPCTLLLMDVDALKFINDVHGHAVGDSVIRYLAEQIKEVVTREGDTAARVGGDEFAVLLNNASDEQGVAVALRIRELLDTPLQTTGRLSVSIGVASCPAHATSVETLYSAAEAAVRYAKHEGGNHIVVSPFKKIA